MLELHNIAKYFSDNNSDTLILDNISLNIEDGEVIAIVGPSGVGKTTLLRIIAGLIKPSSGQVRLDKKLINEPVADIGLIPQDIYLFPWLTVKDNVAFGLNIKKIKPEFKQEMISASLQTVGLARFGNYYPNKLSRGMQQKAALARTLALDQQIILMDEPFASLDYQTKIEMQEFLHRLWLEKKKTLIFVTHDIEEALFMANRILFLGSNLAQEIINVDLPFPRDFAMRSSSFFQELKDKLYQKLKT